MPDLTFSKVDYDAIHQYINTQDIKLLVIDFNGVLDDYYDKKIEFLRDILGPEKVDYLAELLLEIDRAYIKDRSATIESTVERFFDTKGLAVDGKVSELYTSKYLSKMTSSAEKFLDSLQIPFVVYTSLSYSQAQKSIIDNKYDLFTRDKFVEDKPSIANLRIIFEQYGISAEQACVVGDGLIDDLMPASLIGAHTILVSPYVDLLTK